MQDTLRTVRPLLILGGCMLVVAALYWAQAVIVPVALALLLTFMLSPVVVFLQRSMGRVPAVLAVAVVTFTALGVAGWALTSQLASLLQELPAYRQNIRQKVRDIRGAGQGGSVEMLQRTVEDIRSEIDNEETPGTAAKPVVVQSERTVGLWGFPTAVGPFVERLATAGLVLVLVVFMLLERQDMRNRLMRLFGHGRLTVTTKAFDEAGRRISRYLLMQSLINVLFGLGVAVGLYFIGVPYVLLWASAAAALRFIPYVGPWVGAIAPVLVSLAVFEGWTRPLLVLGLFLGLELTTNLVIETYLFAGAAGVSQVGLLVAVAFWTWLWGPLGMLMATPLTVCLAVVGKYVPGLEFVATLISDEPPLDAGAIYYQRLLAGDQAEAMEVLERYVSDGSPAETVYDALMLPALNYAEHDRIEARLTPEEEQRVIEATRELLPEGPAAGERVASGDQIARKATATAASSVALVGYPANGDADAVALRMLACVLEGTPIVLDILSGPPLWSELVELVRTKGYRAVCIADLPPSPSSKSRYLVKRLRAALPDLKLIVGRWAPAALADDTAEPLLAAGADQVVTSLLETREHLSSLLHVLSSEGTTTGAEHLHADVIRAGA
jgi:predicted PurR-regulated permease PerM